MPRRVVATIFLQRHSRVSVDHTGASLNLSTKPRLSSRNSGYELRLYLLRIRRRLASMDTAIKRHLHSIYLGKNCL